MSKFLIEVPHKDNKAECARVVELFLTTGSHFLKQADWGCMDGEHKAWIIADVENKEEARHMLPPIFRDRAKIVSLNKFTLDDIEVEMSRHQD